MRKISYRSGCCFIVALCLMLSSGVSLAASLNLSKTSSASAALVGDVIAFTLTATNTTTSALSNVVLTDALPAGMAYSTHAAPPDTLVSVAGNAVTWSLPSLAANSSAQMTLVVLLTAKGAYTNVVTAPGTASASANILVLDKAVTHYNFDQVPGSLTGAVGEVKDVGTTGLNGRRVLTSGSSIVSNIVSPNPTIAAQNPTVNGGFCNAIRLDGTAVVQVPHSPLFRYENEFSASVWIYATQYPTSSNQYASILSNDQNYEFHLDQNGKLYWWWGADNFTSNTKIALNTWTHVAITFNSAVSPGRQRIYINGVQDSSTKSWGGKLAENPCNFYLGGDVATGSCALIPGRNFVGMIDEAKLYPKELSATEVRADMLLGRSCTNTFDHLQIEHDGAASTCTPETVTIKACQNASCSTLYTDPVTTTLIPSGWVGGDSFTFSGGITTRQLSKTSTGSVNLGSSSPYTCSTGSGTSCALNFVSTSCNFDAVEPTAAPGARLYTKLTGVEFKVDVLALNATKAINTGYAGTVNVDLVDTSSIACPTGAGLTTPAQSLTFATIDKGRKPVLFTYSKAARNVSVRMQVGSGAPACSSDNFTIRPQAITSVTTTTVNADPTGVSASASALKAGSAFDLIANTNTVGYDDKPKLDPSRVEWEFAKRPVDGRADPGGGLVEGEFAVAASAGTGNGAKG
ncbi:MAG: LamG-like jellyroll fold domain-containing protein, partial [Herbaspirillum sp.]